MTTTQSASDLIILAERMGIPVDEAMRQLAQVIADVEPNGAKPQPAAPVAVA